MHARLRPSLSFVPALPLLAALSLGALALGALCACGQPAAVPPPPAPTPTQRPTAPIASASATAAPAEAALSGKWREGERLQVIGDVGFVGESLGKIQWLSDRTLVIQTSERLSLWDIATRAQRAHLPKGGGLVVDPKGRWVAAAGKIFRLDNAAMPTFDFDGRDASPSADGEHLLTTSFGEVKVWSASGGKPVTVKGQYPFGQPCMLEDGHIAVQQYGNKPGIAILDPATVSGPLGGPMQDLVDLHSPDGKRLFAWNAKAMSLHEIDPKNAKVIRTVRIQGKDVYHLSYSRDGGRAAIEDGGGCAVVSTQDGSVVGKVPAPQGYTLTCQLSPDGDRVAGLMYSRDSKSSSNIDFHVSSFGDRPETSRHALRVAHSVERAALAPDMTALAVTTKDWSHGLDIETSLWSLSPPRITAEGLVGLVAVGPGGMAAHAAPDGALRLLDAATGNVTAELPKLPAAPRAMILLAGHVVAGLSDGRVALVDVATKALRFGSRSLQFATGAAEILDIEPSPDKKSALVLARGAADPFDQDKGHGVIAMLDVESAKVGAQTVLNEPAYFATFDAAGGRVAVVSTHVLTIFEPGSPLVEKLRFKDNYMYPGHMRFSDDGSHVIMDTLYGQHGRVYLTSGTAASRPSAAPAATSRALGDRIALGDGERVVVHRGAGGEPLIFRPVSDGKATHLIAYLPSGRLEASAAALAHVPVCAGDPPSEQRCGFAAEMGVPVKSGLVAEWLSRK